MMDHNGQSADDWPGGVCLCRCVCFFVAQVVNALCACGGLPVVTDSCMLQVCLTCVNSAVALFAVSIDDDESARLNINTSDISSFPLAE